MNLIVCVDRENNILKESIILKYLGATKLVNDLIYNKTIVYSLPSQKLKDSFKHCKIFSLKINENDNNLIPSYLKDDLYLYDQITSFEALFNLNEVTMQDNLFVLTEKYANNLIDFVDKVFIIKFNILKDGELVLEHLENSTFWKLDYANDPYFEKNKDYCLLVFKNQNIKQFFEKKELPF